MAFSSPERQRRYRARNRESLNEKARLTMARRRASDPEKMREYFRCWQEKNREKTRAYTRERAAKRRKRIQAFKTETPCADCGGLFHFSAMDFDHVEGKKIACISMMVSDPWERVAAEIAKCEIVCANCHRVRTWKRKTGQRI